MARPVYGKTWWGEQWLNALSHIDYDNRLPRGRSYANKGAARDLVIEGGAIRARVQGRQRSPYRVSMSVPAIPKGDAGRLLDAIAGDPALIAHLLNRQLDPAVLDCATRLDIPVFPARWKDLAMQCSCPDWAVPCKHLAAVIYLLSREIDGNPFLVFSLRGLDLAAALQARNIHIGKQADADLPTFEELFPSEQPGADTGGQVEALEQLQFSQIPDLAAALLHVLPAQPTFFAGGDFREILHRSLARTAVAARRTLEVLSPTPSARRLMVEHRLGISHDAGDFPG